MAMPTSGIRLHRHTAGAYSTQDGSYRADRWEHAWVVSEMVEDRYGFFVANILSDWRTLRDARNEIGRLIAKSEGRKS